MDIAAYYWHVWVNLIGGLGLPIDKYLLAYTSLAAVFYCIGVAFKFLIRR